jgi:hypothetical protein
MAATLAAHRSVRLCNWRTKSIAVYERLHSPYVRIRTHGFEDDNLKSAVHWAAIWSTTNVMRVGTERLRMNFQLADWRSVVRRSLGDQLGSLRQAYVLAPEKWGGEKGYALLRDAMQLTNKVGIAAEAEDEPRTVNFMEMLKAGVKKTAGTSRPAPKRAARKPRKKKAG